MTGPAAEDWQGALPRGAILRGYTIQQVLGQGGLGIVYLARHVEGANLVAIREYMPRDLAIRDGSHVCRRHTSCLQRYEDGLRRFADEGKALSEFRGHPNIVTCQESFQDNGTAYLVMDFVDGLPLSQVLSEREGQGRPFGEEDLMSLAIPLIKGLQSMHQAGLIHRNLRPQNVRLCETSGQPVIIGFGHINNDVSDYTEATERTSSGYTAWEQLVAVGHPGPWTDIYAVGALLWRIVAGGNVDSNDTAPVPVENRAHALIREIPDPMPSAIEVGDGRFHAGLLTAIDRCLELNHVRRIQTCARLLDLLRGDAQFQFELATKYLRHATEPSVSKEPQIKSYAENDSSHLKHSEEAVEWFRRSAAQDHIGSIQALVGMDHPVHSHWAITRLRDMIDNSLRDQGTSQCDADLHKRAIEWYTSGGMHTTRAIGLRLDFLYDMGSREILDVYLDSDYENRAYTYSQAEQGDADSQFECGIVAQFKDGFLSTYEWINGDPYARDFQNLITEFGTDYLACPEVSVGKFCDAFQKSEAFRWFEKAAQSERSSSDLDEDRQPNLGAINNLGIYRALGSDDLGNHSAAFDLFLNAANSGHSGAQFNLGVCYSRGIGTDVDSAKAFEWFWKSAHRRGGYIWHENSEGVGYCRVIGNSISDWEYVYGDAVYDPFIQGIIDAQYNLGVSFLKGTGTVRDVDASILWLSVAARHGDRRALADLGWTSSGMLRAIFEDYHESNPYPPPDTDRKSIARYRTDSERNNCCCSQAFMGWLYSLGLELERDAIEAFKCFSSARRNFQDSSDIEAYFGYMWAVTRSGKSSTSATDTINTGNTSSPDCVPWSLKFAPSDVESRNEQSQAVSSEFATCKHWASLGDPDAQYFCGWMCAAGHGSEARASEAAEWYERAASQGHVSAAHQLGLMYEDGHGVAQDLERAAEWYRTCARHDRADCQYRLAKLYETGRGVAVDLKAAVALYRQAAEHAHPLARFRLGLAYETGVGVERDFKMALRYYLEAYDPN